MTKMLSIFLFALTWTSVFGQTTKLDTTKGYVLEMCVFKKGKPGHSIKNERIGMADTTVAFVRGQVREKQDLVPFAIVTFINSQGQTSSTMTDADGNYSIVLNNGEYSVKFFCLGYNGISIDKVILGTGQIQELTVDIGTAGGFHTYVVDFKKKPTEEELKAKEKELIDE